MSFHTGSCGPALVGRRRVRTIGFMYHARIRKYARSGKVFAGSAFARLRGRHQRTYFNYEFRNPHIHNYLYLRNSLTRTLPRSITFPKYWAV